MSNKLVRFLLELYVKYKDSCFGLCELFIIIIIMHFELFEKKSICLQYVIKLDSYDNAL